METKIVNLEEMNDLVNLSRNAEHPYYYRFRYSLKQRAFIASRARKDLVRTLPERDVFNTIDIDSTSALGNAIVKLENAKSRIGGFNYV